MDWLVLIPISIGLVFFGGFAFAIYAGLREKRAARANDAKSEALFRSMFPELQPWFHPRNLIEFVRELRRLGRPAGGVWRNPAGLGVAAARFSRVDDRETVDLLDEADAVLTQFRYEDSADGGVLRSGKGKLTVSAAEGEPRVRYWHPDREFKWKRGQWTFQSRLSDQAIESGDSGTRFSSESPSSSSSSSVSRTAAAAAGIVAAGGSFDGGGASQAWDEGGAGSSDASAGDSSRDSGDGATATAY